PRRHTALRQRLDRRILMFEDSRRSNVDVHLLGHREGLDHCPIRSQVAAQHCDAAIRAERIQAWADDLVFGYLDVVQVAAPLSEEKPAVLNLLQVLSKGLTGNGEAIQ